jgi:hypothetical protein
VEADAASGGAWKGCSVLHSTLRVSFEVPEGSWTLRSSVAGGGPVLPHGDWGLDGASGDGLGFELEGGFPEQDAGTLDHEDHSVELTCGRELCRGEIIVPLTVSIAPWWADASHEQVTAHAEFFFAEASRDEGCRDDDRPAPRPPEELTVRVALEPFALDTQPTELNPRCLDSVGQPDSGLDAGNSDVLDAALQDAALGDAALGDAAFEDAAQSDASPAHADAR